ncbi:YcnI family protein [Homoserinibacter sp. GY 40078]|uniref:YcnI family protein n=1 Tax=Homoserinibacter sp. GY 40078 TaxID=2603275 RepID=UPI00164FE7DF|nr:YcnI family protein [Homoserinibacter sp. GY 40078]
MTKSRFAAASGAAVLGAAALTLLAAPAAFAHTTVEATSTAAGSYTVLTFASGHSCDGSPTTSFTIDLPDGINAASPEILAGWKVEKVMETLDTPITDSHGNELTERVSQIVYTADTPFPEGFRVSFDVSLQLPEDAAGETLYFPTVQQCEEGSNDWIEIPADGQDDEELASPAPALEVTEAVDDEHGHGDAAETEHAEGEHADEVSDSSPALAVGIAGLAVGALGLVVALVALLRRRPAA